MTHRDSGIAYNVRSLLLPSIGIGLLLSMFRYTSFPMGLYPEDYAVSLFGVPIQSYTAFLIPLALYAAITLCSKGRVPDHILRRPVRGVALALAGSVGALFAASTAGSPNQATVWLSSSLLAVGYLSVYIMWISYIADDFTTRKLLVLFCGHLVSLLIARYSDAWRPASALFISFVPLLSAVIWLPCRHAGDACDPSDGGKGRLPLRDPSVWLFIAFLLAGGIVRGLVNESGILPANSYAYSIVIALAMIAGCIYLTFSETRQGTAEEPRSGARRISRFIVICWGAVTALFVIGMFLFVICDDQILGGRIATLSRSALNVVYLAFLCDRLGKSSPFTVSYFILYDLLVNIVSWALSYIALPMGLPALSGPEGEDSRLLVTLSVFVLVAVTTSACGISMSLSTKAGTLAHEDGDGDRHHAIADEEVVRMRLTEGRGLTAREASVVLLYARGYSLGKVADEVGITLSTARTHIKHAYRKLGVHSKDELIETIVASK